MALEQQWRPRREVLGLDHHTQPSSLAEGPQGGRRGLPRLRRDGLGFGGRDQTLSRTSPRHSRLVDGGPQLLPRGLPAAVQPDVRRDAGHPRDAGRPTHLLRRNGQEDPDALGPLPVREESDDLPLREFTAIDTARRHICHVEKKGSLSDSLTCCSLVLHVTAPT